MKKKPKQTETRTKPGDLARKSRAVREIFKAAEKAGTDPVVSQSFAKPAPCDPSGWVACGACRHGESHATPNGTRFVCRSFLSDRAGFTHQRSYACGYGRKRETVEA